MSNASTKTKFGPVTLNREQGLFILPCQEGFSCLGFDVCRGKIVSRSRWLAQNYWHRGVTEGGVTYDPRQLDDTFERIGRGITRDFAGYPDDFLLEMYRIHQAVNQAVSEHCRGRGVRCETDLTPQLIGLENKWVQVLDSYGTDRFFKVGKSTGHIPIHLEIETARNCGGGSAYGFPYQSIKVITMSQAAILRREWGGNDKYMGDTAS